MYRCMRVYVVLFSTIPFSIMPFSMVPFSVMTFCVMPFSFCSISFDLQNVRFDCIHLFSVDLILSYIYIHTDAIYNACLLTGIQVLVIQSKGSIYAQDCSRNTHLVKPSS